jgi:hypothetical protein
VKPEPIVCHESKEVLSRLFGCPARATNSAITSVFAACVQGQCKGSLAEPSVGPIEVFDLNAVIGVDAFSSGNSQRIGAPILISQNRDIAVWPPRAKTSECQIRK